jgi:hypothetical protein
VPFSVTAPPATDTIAISPAACVTLITIAVAPVAVTVTVAGVGAAMVAFASALKVKPVAVFATLHHVWLLTASHALWLVATVNVALPSGEPSALNTTALCDGEILSVGAGSGEGAGAFSFLQEIITAEMAAVISRPVITFFIAFIFLLFYAQYGRVIYYFIVYDSGAHAGAPYGNGFSILNS